jgi:hypothetical protein
MARIYKLREIDDGPLDNPSARWRTEPATVRQYRRLEFFRVSHRRTLTKGEAADLIDNIDPTAEQLESYEAWKAYGTPNIKQWHKRWDPFLNEPVPVQKKGCFFYLGAIALGFISLCILIAILSPDEPTPTRTILRSTPLPTPTLTPVPITTPPTTRPVQTQRTFGFLRAPITIRVKHGQLVITKNTRVDILREIAGKAQINVSGQVLEIASDQIE